LGFKRMNEKARGHKTKTTHCIVQKKDSNLTGTDAPRPRGSHHGAIQKGETKHQYYKEWSVSQIYAELNIESVDLDLICIMQFERYSNFFTNSIKLFR
jgi:hypothetical protein